MTLESRIAALEAQIATMTARGGLTARSGCPACHDQDLPLPALCCVRCGSRWYDTEGE